MLELGKPIHTFDAAAVARRPDRRPPRDGRASGSRRSTTSSASSTRRRCSSPTRRGPIGIAGVMGGADVRGRPTRRRDVDRRVGDLRPGQHPADGVPLRAALRGEPPLREGPGVPAGADRRRPDGAAHRRVGGRRRSRRARSTRTRRARAGHASRSGRPGSTACSARTLATDEQRDAPRAASGSRPNRPPAGARVPVADGAAAARDGGRVTARRSSRSFPTWRRDLTIEADVAEEVARVRGYELIPAILPRHADAALPALAARGPRRVRETLAGAGLTEVVTYALVAPDDRSSASGRVTTATVGGRAGAAPAARPITVTNPLSSQHSVLRQSLLGSLLEVVGDEPAPRPRRRRDLRDRQGLRHGRRRRDARVVAARARADRRGRAAAWNRPAAAVRPRRRQGPARADLPAPRASSAPSYAAADRTTRTSTRAGRRASRRRRPSCDRRGVGELHPALVADARTCDGDRVVVAELAIAGLAGGLLAAGRAARRRRATRPSSATSRSSSPRTGPRPRSSASIRRHGGDAPRGGRAVRHLPRPAARRRPRRASPAGCVPGAGSHAHRGRGRRRGRGDHGRPGRATSAAASGPDARAGPYRSACWSGLAAADRPLLPLRGFGARHGPAFRTR